MDENQTKVSRFYDMWDVEPKESSVEEFRNNVSGAKLKAKTEQYRSLLEQNRLEEAAKLKKKFPGVTMAGVCEGKRSDGNLKTLSRRAMFDFDHTDGRTAEVKALLCRLGYVELVWTSISGKGLKATVPVDVNDAAEYAAAYAIVARELSQVAGHPCDGACENLSRLCSEVYDPEIFYNPAAAFFPWRELWEKERPEVVLRDEPKPEGASQGEGTGLLAGFLKQFLEKRPFVSGTRHESMLQLGHAARSKNLSPKELAELVQVTASKLATADFTASEIESCIRAGYQYLSGKPALQKSAVYGQKVQSLPMNPSFRSANQDEQEELSEKSNELRASMPYFPKEVYECLPDLLKRGIALARGDRERDMLLMGMLAHLSACLPDVFFNYDQMEYSPHFYSVAVAHAGTGKGVVTLAAAFSQEVHDYYARQGEAEMKAYEERLRVWEESHAEDKRKHKKMSTEPRPEEPHLVSFMIPANSSKAKVYGHLRDNGALGGIIHASEINTLASAMGQDYGKQDDLLCAAYHHEEISSSFKVDGALIVVRSPRLAMCLTGTPDQLVALVRSQENGLFSRLTVLTAETQWVWRSAAPRHDGVEFRSYFRELGKEVLHMHQMMQGKRTWVTFTDAQWKAHTDFFGQRLQGVVVEGDDSPGAMVLRHGLLAMRIAAILTALRKCEDEFWAAGERICTDEDFHIAMQLTEVLLEHGLLLSSSLPELALKALPLREFHRFLPVLEKMPEEFSFTDFVNEAAKQNLSVSTGKRMLKKAEKASFVKHEGVKYRKLPDVGGKLGL
ncbi:DUF3987 domain-containing protein [Bacteroides sp.]|uniref:DUF3987 domain-containing protein n=1 Tax=Bacteroides sp. TaxID=29523 RepID=UPI003AB33E83